MVEVEDLGEIITGTAKAKQARAKDDHKIGRNSRIPRSVSRGRRPNPQSAIGLIFQNSSRSKSRKPRTPRFTIHEYY